MRKIIIKIEDDAVTDKQAVELVSNVIGHGRISKTNKKLHYCWLTRVGDVSVHVMPKYGHDNDVFVVRKDG